MCDYENSVFKRKIIFIKKEFQAKLIVIMLLLVFIFANTVFTFSMLFLNFFSKETLNIIFSTIDLKSLFLALTVIELLGFIFVFYIGLYISFRMAGPVYRLEKCAEQISEGDLSFNIKLRKYDEFQELACAMDVMSKKIKDKIVNIKEVFNDISEVAREISLKAKDDGACKLGGEAEKLSELVEHAGAFINEFKLEKNFCAAVNPKENAINVNKSDK